MNIKQTLELYGIDAIWHFTDKSNLESIKRHGILSLEQIQSKNIQVSCFGANELSHRLDKMYGLDKFVHLSFIKEHPMQYIKKANGDLPDPIWIKIKASVLYNSNSIFSDDVANKKDSKIYNIDLLDNVIDLEVLWERTDWRDSSIQQRRKIAKRGEIMVPNQINVSDIMGVYHG